MPFSKFGGFRHGLLAAAPKVPESGEPVLASEKLGITAPRPPAVTDYQRKFSDETHNYVREYIRNADQKAAFFFAALTAILAFLNSQNVPSRWLKNVTQWSFVDGLGFVSMFGNVPFALRMIGFAVVFTILVISANTMVMAVRERTSEVGVLKTLGFEDGTIFRIVLLEAAFITLGGGVAGSLLAKFAIEGSRFSFGGFLPPMSVYWSTVLTGIALALLMLPRLPRAARLGVEGRRPLRLRERRREAGAQQR